MTESFCRDAPLLSMTGLLKSRVHTRIHGQNHLNHTSSKCLNELKQDVQTQDKAKPKLEGQTLRVGARERRRLCEEIQEEDDDDDDETSFQSDVLALLGLSGKAVAFHNCCGYGARIKREKISRASCLAPLCMPPWST